MLASMNASPSNPQGSVESRVARLRDCLNKGHVKASIQLCDSLLKEVPTTEDLHAILLRNKARLMIQGKQFSSLIHHSRTLSTEQLDCIKQEVAYAHYRLGNYEQALNAVKGIDASLLKAQILYRLDLFGEAIKEYEAVLGSTNDPTTISEVAVNLSACKAAHALSTGDAPMTSSQGHGEASPEHTYNEATVLIGLKKFKDAKEHLNQAIDACDDAQIRAQMQYQLAYCDHHLGLPVHPPKLGQDKLVNSLISILGGDAAPRRLVSMMQSLMPKYASYQRPAINYNLAALHHELGNVSKARRVAKALASDDHLGHMARDLLAQTDKME